MTVNYVVRAHPAAPAPHTFVRSDVMSAQRARTAATERAAKTYATPRCLAWTIVEVGDDQTTL